MNGAPTVLPVVCMSRNKIARWVEVEGPPVIGVIVRKKKPSNEPTLEPVPGPNSCVRPCVTPKA